MRELGPAAIQPRAYKRTTRPGQTPVESPDLISRDFTADAPARRLVGDITYLRMGQSPSGSGSPVSARATSAPRGSPVRV
jgi:transposase InsO family protein